MKELVDTVASEGYRVMLTKCEHFVVFPIRKGQWETNATD
jgi:hypothetical protein